MNKLTLIPLLFLLTLTGCAPNPNQIPVTTEQRNTEIMVTGKIGDKIIFSDGQQGRVKNPEIYEVGATYTSVVISKLPPYEIRKAVQVIESTERPAVLIEGSNGNCMINSRGDASSMQCF